MSVKDSLKEKITTEGRTNELYSELDYSQRSFVSNLLTQAKYTIPTSIVVKGSNKVTHNWWALREAMRLYFGVYEISTTLAELNKRFPMFAHVSIEDNTLVAYTPDNRFGEEDRQLKTTPGKYFSKMMPIATDDYIRKLTEEHMAEACSTLEWIEGTAIADFYWKMAEDMSGLRACMSKTTAWSKKENPTLAYDAPGVKLAVLRTPDGKAVARNLTFENKRKKVWIRNYGSTGLVDKLTKLGYSKGNWSGANLKLVFTEEGSNRDDHIKIAFPYLDANGGMANSSDTTVAVVGDIVRVLNNRDREVIDSRYRGVPSSTGYIEIKPTPKELYEFQCAISGTVVNRFNTEENLLNVWKDGKLCKALEDAIVAATEYSVCAKFIDANRKTTTVWAKPEDTIEGYVNDEASLSRLGYAYLPAGKYAEAPTLIKKSQLIEINGEQVPISHAIKVYTKGSATYVLKEGFDKKQYVKLYDGAFCEKDAGWVKTATGRKVLPQIHEVAKLFTGEWVFTRGYRTTDIGDTRFAFKSALLSQINALDFKEAVDALDREHGYGFDWETCKTLILDITSLSGMRNALETRSGASLEGCDWSWGGTYKEPPLAILRVLPEYIKQTISKRHFAIHRQMQHLKNWLAEMDAVEAPEYLQSMPVQPITIVNAENSEQFALV